MRQITLLNKEYDGESIYDCTRDFAEAFDPAFTPEFEMIPTDPHGIQKGTFKVVVIWEDSA